MIGDIHEADDVERRASEGQASAFGHFVRRHDRHLRNVGWSVVRSPHQIDDIMQSAYERAFRNLGSFDGRSSLRTWLASIVYRTAIDHVRYEGRRRHPSLDDTDSAIHHDLIPAGADELASRIVDRDELNRVLARLDPLDAAVLTMTAGLGYTYDEVAVITGLARGTVSSRASRARSRLAKEGRS